MTGTGHLWRCLRGGGWRLGRGPFSRQRRVGRSSRSFCWSRRFSFVVFVFFGVVSWSEAGAKFFGDRTHRRAGWNAAWIGAIASGPASSTRSTWNRDRPWRGSIAISITSSTLPSTIAIRVGTSATTIDLDEFTCKSWTRFSFTRRFDFHSIRFDFDF